MLLSSNLPGWLQALVQEKFFNACIIHEEAKKNEKNVFCLDCCTSICPHCLPHHHSHRLLQIRRYVYNDVLRLEDAKKLMDCKFVQAYTNNRAKVVFLNRRPVTRYCRDSGSACYSCDRSLQDPFLFCSLSCKINYLIRTKGVAALSEHLFDGESLSLPEPGRDNSGELDDGQMTPDSVLEPAGSGSVRTSSGSGGSGGVWCQTVACTATTDVVRKKRSSLHRPVVCPPVRLPTGEDAAAAMANRRKGTPHRAPLY